MCIWLLGGVVNHPFILRRGYNFGGVYMHNFYLRQSSIYDGFDCYDMLQNIGSFEHHFVNDVYGKSYDFYKDWLKLMDDWSVNKNLPDGYVQQTIFWFYLDDIPIGIGKLRHILSNRLMSTCGGNLGYAIDSRYRGKGYGQVLVKLLINKAKELRIPTLVASVLKDNEQSNKIMSRISSTIINENDSRRCYLLY